MALSTILLVVVTTAATTSAGGVGRNFVPGPPEARATEFTGPPYEAPFLIPKPLTLGQTIKAIVYVLGTMYPAPPPEPPSPPVVRLTTPQAAPQITPANGSRPRAETPISGERCVDRGRADIGQMIEATFGPAGPWAESVAVRESGCTPTAINGGGCQGLFQFCGHDDIFLAICGSVAAWTDPKCSIAAAYSLYMGRGISPWKL